MMHDELTKIKEVLHYNPKTGVFKWTENAKSFRGQVAGYETDYGYKKVTVFGKKYSQHRLAWWMYHGEMPKNNVDHIDGNRTNNRIKNLRDVDTKTNNQNKRTASKRSKLGILGVRKVGNQYRSEIYSDEKRIHLGYYSTPELAHQVYINAKRELHQGNTL